MGKIGNTESNLEDVQRLDPRTYKIFPFCDSPPLFEK